MGAWPGGETQIDGVVGAERMPAQCCVYMCALASVELASGTAARRHTDRARRLNQMPAGCPLARYGLVERQEPDQATLLREVAPDGGDGMVELRLRVINQPWGGVDQQGDDQPRACKNERGFEQPLLHASAGRRDDPDRFGRR